MEGLIQLQGPFQAMVVGLLLSPQMESLLGGIPQRFMARTM
jgi:hypothetical protein